MTGPSGRAGSVSFLLPEFLHKNPHTPLKDAPEGGYDWRVFSSKAVFGAGSSVCCNLAPKPFIQGIEDFEKERTNRGKHRPQPLL